MEKIPAEFLDDAIISLTEMIDELRQVKAGTIAFSSKKLFRILHTIKGSAQTFGFNSEAQLTHQIESFLSAKQAVGLTDPETDLLNSALETLRRGLQHAAHGETAPSHEELAAELMNAAGLSVSNNSEQILPDNFPVEISGKLSEHETKLLCESWAGGKEILILQFEVERESFGARFKEIREGLDSYSEVIAVSPEAQTTENKASFRFLISSDVSPQLASVLLKFSGKVFFQKRRNEREGTGKLQYASNKSIDDEFAAVVLNGEIAATELGKNVKFVVMNEAGVITRTLSKTVSTVLLHLVRNAVDHGIEFPLERAAFNKPAYGTVEIGAQEKDGNLVIKICDDGRGHDNGDEMFDAGFTTAPFVTQFSGRGVGLDAVLEALNQAEGTIKSESKPGHGSTFYFSLPITNER